MTAKRAAVVVAVVFVAYAVLLGWRGVLLIGTGDPVAVGLGIAVLVIPLVGLYLVWREIQFGRRTEALAHELGEAGGLPVDDLPRRPSGRIDRARRRRRLLAVQGRSRSRAGGLAGLVPAFHGVRRGRRSQAGPVLDADRDRPSRQLRRPGARPTVNQP
ncbi:hypothetical protein [Kribbella qitaiheensis]|uniref:hypothetical protein n=1 Tax=Kribbella qitaiheensis TaxID=1544730 RepID=UPI001FE25AFA|nr:hypothetical protein [Kribbella qitaiheensis]